MAETAELGIILRAKDEASAAINRVKGSLGGIGSVAKTAAIGLGIATAGVGALAVVGLQFVKAAAQEQASIARLDQAIRNAGGAIDQNIAKSKEAVKAGERLAFSDDEVRSGLALLVAQTGDYEEAQRRMVVAQELARGANLDLELASKLVGKITDENVQVLKRYGITLRQGATDQEALAEIQKRFGGQAEAFAKTGEGAWQRLGNQIQNVKEAIGLALLPSFTRASTALADFLTAHQDDIERLSLLFSDQLAGAINGIGDAIQQLRHPFKGVGGPLLSLKLQFLQFGQAVVTGLLPVIALLDTLANWEIDLGPFGKIKSESKAVADAHKNLEGAEKDLAAAVADANARLVLQEIGFSEVAATAPDATAALAYLKAMQGNVRDATDLSNLALADAREAYAKTQEPVGALGGTLDHLTDTVDTFTLRLGLAKLGPFADALRDIKRSADPLPESIMLIAGAIDELLRRGDLLAAQGLAFQIPASASTALNLATGFPTQGIAGPISQLPGAGGVGGFAAPQGFGGLTREPVTASGAQPVTNQFTFHITADPGWNYEQMQKMARILRGEFERETIGATFGGAFATVSARAVY